MWSPCRSSSGREIRSRMFGPGTAHVASAATSTCVRIRRRFPPYGSDFEVFEDRFIEVMQFVVNHTTFDPNDELDAGLLAVLKPLGVAPGNTYDPDTAPEIDGDALRAVAQAAPPRNWPISAIRTGWTRTWSNCFSPRARFRSRSRPSSRSPGRSGSPPIRRSTGRSSLRTARR